MGVAFILSFFEDGGRWWVAVREAGRLGSAHGGEGDHARKLNFLRDSQLPPWPPFRASSPSVCAKGKGEEEDTTSATTTPKQMGGEEREQGKKEKEGEKKDGEDTSNSEVTHPSGFEHGHLTPPAGHHSLDVARHQAVEQASPLGHHHVQHAVLPNARPLPNFALCAHSTVTQGDKHGDARR